MGTVEGDAFQYQPQGIGYSNTGAQFNSSDLTVVVQQPRTGYGLMVSTIQGHRGWSSGICACFSDCVNCLFTWWCYPCAMCRLATRTGDCCCTPCCVPGYGVALRARIRTLGGIQGSICDDCCITECCTLCAACQMARELDMMGVP